MAGGCGSQRCHHKPSCTYRHQVPRLPPGPCVLTINAWFWVNRLKRLFGCGLVMRRCTECLINTPLSPPAAATEVARGKSLHGEVAKILDDYLTENLNLPVRPFSGGLCYCSTISCPGSNSTFSSRVCKPAKMADTRVFRLDSLQLPPCQRCRPAPT